jgi:NAD(P)-dependent dehydrogenase (short-subunit alcohol dehydrogenase family)
MVHALGGNGTEVIGLSRSAPDPADRLDLLDEASIAAAAGRVSAGGPVDLVLVASGMLHQEGQLPEKSFRDLSADALARSFAINSIGPALTAKHFLPLLPRHGRSVFAALSARVGSISDNQLGGWYGYRASKAALNMLVQTLAIELARTRREALCVALHPGTVNTGLSKPFQRAVAPEKLFTPLYSAERMLAVLATLRPEDNGGCFAWDGLRIPS